jgi:hypothetical protein
VLTTDQKGAIAEAAVTLAALKLGIGVYRPVAEGVHCLELDRCYLLPAAQFSEPTYVQLRIEPTRNNQRRKVNWAEDFNFEARLSALGAVAQLGEHLAGSQKATGSSPVGSTDGSPGAARLSG